MGFRYVIPVSEYQKMVDRAAKVAPLGSIISAPIYNLRFKYGVGNEVRQAKVVSYTLKERCEEGFRFGIHVEYEGSEYWVSIEDLERMQK